MLVTDWGLVSACEGPPLRVLRRVLSTNPAEKGPDWGMMGARSVNRRHFHLSMLSFEAEAAVQAEPVPPVLPVLYLDDVMCAVMKPEKLLVHRTEIANGDTVRLALEAAQALSAAGISARVLDMHTIKPLDVEAVQACIDETGKIITVEDHNILNGLGSAVADVVAESGRAVLRRVGIQDQFGMSASYDCLLAMNGITAEHIVELAHQLCGK